MGVSYKLLDTMYLQSYKELKVWQRSMELVHEVYVMTRVFPREETYGLSIQMRRAAVSIPSNIAEGQRRKDLPEYLHFLRIADASSAELETQVILSRELYPAHDFSKLLNLLNEVQKMLYKMISVLSLKAQSSKLKAFTLIELLVSMGIFVVLISIATNAFIISLRSQHAASALIAVNDNLSLVLEQMAREMRTGKGFCSRSIINGVLVASPIPNVSGFDFLQYSR